MGLFKKLWQDRRKVKPDAEFETTEWEEIVYDRDDLQIQDREQRRDYIKNCLDQIAEASEEVENLQLEYDTVTLWLKDMEEIDALPEEEHQELEDAARRIAQLEDQQNSYLKRKVRMGEAQYRKMEALGEEAQEGYRKLKEAEEYQVKIKSDMKHLNNEKDAYLYRKYELQRLIGDLRNMMVICITAIVLCFLLLLILQMVFAINTRIGYLLTGLLAGLAMILIFYKYQDSTKELKQVEKSINKIILLHNRVKIRYVNNTNLLEYLQIKYTAANAQELNKMWLQYQEERAEREVYRQAEQELDICQRDLLHILRRYQVSDSALWLHQTAALLDKKEMVEIRHNLIIRRQSLRRRIDYNKEVVAHKAQEEIKDLVEKYPQYATEILEMVSVYERKHKG